MYLELIGGKQTKLSFNDKAAEFNSNEDSETFSIMEFYNKKEILPKKGILESILAMEHFTFLA